MRADKRVRVTRGVTDMAKSRTPAKTGQRKATAVDRHIGKRIRETRLVHDMPQEKLAGILGVTFQQVQKYESGANRISASRLYEVAKALKVPVWHFFEGLK